MHYALVGYRLGTATKWKWYHSGLSCIPRWERTSAFLAMRQAHTCMEAIIHYLSRYLGSKDPPDPDPDLLCKTACIPYVGTAPKYLRIQLSTDHRDKALACGVLVQSTWAPSKVAT